MENPATDQIASAADNLNQACQAHRGSGLLCILPQASPAWVNGRLPLGKHHAVQNPSDEDPINAVDQTIDFQVYLKYDKLS